MADIPTSKMQPPDNYQYNQPQQFPPPTPNPASPFDRQKPGWRGRLILLGIWAFLYLLACALPALEFSNENLPNENWPGIQVLAIGWLGGFLYQFAWYANLPLLLALILLLLRRWVGVLVSGVLALLLAMNTFLLYSQRVPANEGGTSYLHLVQVKIGFYFWVLSILALCVGALILRRREPAASPPQQLQQAPPYQGL
jgi:hypothetical protein